VERLNACEHSVVYDMCHVFDLFLKPFEFLCTLVDCFFFSVRIYVVYVEWRNSSQVIRAQPWTGTSTFHLNVNPRVPRYCAM
jgi:hypothetical protein